MSDTIPTLAGFQTWVYTVMGVPVAALPNSDAGTQAAFEFSMEMIPPYMNQISPLIYTNTVYNWGGSYLIQMQQDQAGQTYFKDARTAFGVNNFVAGVISSAGDEGTNESLQIGKGLSNLDLMSLQRIKDPYGRAAVANLQSLGSMWGLT